MTFKRLLPIMGALFIVGYLPTAAIFTTRFFLDHAPIVANFNILGLPAVKVLPMSVAVLLCSMELFAFRLALVFWNASGSSTRLAVISVMLFAALQILPSSSTYLGTRAAAYQQLVRQAEGRVREAQDANAREDTRRAADVAVRANDLARLQGQRANITSEIRQASDAIARLQRSSRAVTPFVTAELSRLDELLRSQTRLRNQIDEQLIARSAASLETPKTVSSSVGVPPFSDFLADSFWSFEALLSLMVSLVFPLAVLAYGFICTKGIERAEMPVFDLTRELEIGAARPVAEHVAFAELLKSAITAYAIAQRTGGNLADEAVILRMRDDRAIELIEMFNDLKDQIGGSKLSPEAKKELVVHIDELQAHGIHRKQKEAA
ncbi:MAG: hypothetical protein K2Y23_10065 [Cyanobacteria bacterium]|nr:hypothetical protein [Cyanobacteriota bacterium]